MEVAGIEPVPTIWKRLERLVPRAKSRLAGSTFWTRSVAALTPSTCHESCQTGSTSATAHSQGRSPSWCCSAMCRSRSVSSEFLTGVMNVAWSHRGQYWGSSGKSVGLWVEL
jgi:hypothetical protein